MKTKLTFVLVFLLATSIFVSAASASAAPYTYRVRIYAGNEGSFGTDGSSYLEYKNVKPGSTITFDNTSVVLKHPDKYYVKGIRESGLDTEKAVANMTITVNADVDYVVAYGVKSRFTR